MKKHRHTKAPVLVRCLRCSLLSEYLFPAAANTSVNTDDLRGNGGSAGLPGDCGERQQSRFRIVYDTGNYTYANVFRPGIKDRCGVLLEISGDSVAESGYEILVGNVTRAAFETAKTGEYGYAVTLCLTENYAAVRISGRK